MVGMTTSGSVRTPDGQRVVIVLRRVQKRTPSRPCMWWSPNSDCFQPPNEWNAVGTKIGTLTPTMPTSMSWANARAASPSPVNTATPLA